MTALLALIRKDLILFRSDRRALLLTLLMPIVLGSFFGYLFGGSGTTEHGKIDVGLSLQDDTEIGKKIAAGLRADTTLHIIELSQHDAEEQVRKGKLNAAIVIPSEFGDKAGAALFGGAAKPDITIYYDPSQNMVLPMVKGLLTQQVMQIVTAEMFGGAGGKKMAADNLARLDDAIKRGSTQDNPALRDLLKSVLNFLEKTATNTDANAAPATTARGLSLPFATTDQALTSGPNKYNGYAHAFAGMSVQFILFMAIDAGIGILLARRLGLWNRLLAAPITVTTILTARGLSCALIAFFLQCFIFAAAALLFHVRVDGSLAGFIGILLSFSLMTASFGLLIAALGKTPEAARGISVFATLIMVMLGGAWVPAFLFPQWLQTVTLAIPTRWAVDGLDAMTWRGLGFAAAIGPIAVLIGFTVVFGSLAAWKFHREAGR
jgi:ABC-2 type transport system permease protein